MRKICLILLLLLTPHTLHQDVVQAKYLTIYSSQGIVKQQYTNNMNNNNPFNIRYNINNNWVGVVRPPKAGFEQFISMKYGLRAGLKLLMNYYNNHGLNTIEGIVHRFAPATENDTDKYIAFVCSKTKYAPDQVIDLNNKTTLFNVAKAILKMESNMNATTEQLNGAYNTLYKP